MNTENMTREEFDRQIMSCANPHGQTSTVTRVRDEFWDRIDAIQNRPFQPDWSLKPSWAIGFSGRFIGLDEYGKDPQGPGEFYIPAPHNPTDAELVAMFDKLDLDKKLEVLRDAGVVV